MFALLPVWLVLSGSWNARGWAAGVVINEFLAINEETLTDEDGDPSDWLEIHNAEPFAVDLSGWYLTDRPGELKWRFPDSPDLLLEPGDYLVVFCSGKDRAGPEYHTNWRLSGAGEYLALIEANGETVAHQYVPEYPEQRENVSYGLAEAVETLVAPGGAAEIIVPEDGNLGLSWTEAGFVAGPAWIQGVPMGIGYDVGGAGVAHPPPVSSWSFDGTVADGTGTNDGTFVGGAPAYVEGHDGEAGGALAFDGSDDYVDVSQRVGLPIYSRPAYTISMWVKGLPQNDKRVFSEGSGSNNNPLFTIGTERSGDTGQVDIFIRYADGSGPSHIISNGVAFDGTWHHVAWVDADGDAALYIDGVRDPVNFSYSKRSMALDITSIGSVLRASPCCFFAGAIDDVAIWDEVLSEEAIADLAAGVPPGAGSLFGRWIETDVEEVMQGVNSTIYARLPFEIEDLAVFDSLTLSIRYADGFVAYLNGVEVARRNASASLSWNSTASADRPEREATALEGINLTAFLGVLEPGLNVLALHGLNFSADDENFLLSPELVAAGSTATEPRFFRTPTPGFANQGGVIDFVADTKFSVDRGFYEEPLEIEITTETEGATIRYTLDGTAPTQTHGDLYTDPLLIDTTTVLRAVAFREGFEPTNVDTHTYIFLDDVIRQPPNPAGYPSSWAGYAADYAMDPEICTNVASPHFQPTIKEDLKAIPTLSLVLAPDDFTGSARGIYTHPQNRGQAWERAASVELIVPDESEDGFQVNCGVRMQGGSSARPIEGKHSFRLLFKREHGPTRLRYRFFKDSSLDEFDGFVLRCFSTDSWHFKDGGSRYRRWDSQYIRDIWMRDTQLDMGHLSGHSRYVHLYVNGLYWGLYNPTERPDDAFHSLHMGDRKEDWDIVKDFTESFRGDLQAWNQMMNLANAGLGSAAAYQRIQGNHPDGTPNPDYPVLLDVDNLIDYMMLHLFAGAEDWPHHNWYAARSRTGNLGGWRFLVWDQEIVLDFAYRNRINVDNDGSPARVYARLRANPEFRVRFGDRVHRHFFNGGDLTVEESQRRWLRRANEIDRAIVGESARWGDFRLDRPDPSNSPAELYTREDHWLVEKEKVLNTYLPESHRLALERFRAGDLYPVVEAPVFSRHGGLITSGFELEITAPAGTIYYTLDGSDPRLEGGAVSPTAAVAGEAVGTTLVASGAPVLALVPGDGSLGLAWTEIEFEDPGWTEGTTGVGYERTSGYEDLIGTDLLEAMDGENASVYARILFDVADPGSLDSLTLRMKYDDGFIAYLNGAEVARSNAPADAGWDAVATQPNTDSNAVVFESFDVSAFVGLLEAGANVLAIHGLNSSATSSDMLILPELVSAETTGGGIPIDEPTLVKSRAFDGEWSALNGALFYFDIPLRITEIMYHPAPPPEESPFDAEDFAFIEIQNVGSSVLDLTGVRLTEGVEFDFTGFVTRLDPGGIVVVVDNIQAFASRYGLGVIQVAGAYRGNLSNGGEFIRLTGAHDEPILEFAYEDDWYPETDGMGSSLVIVDAGGDRATWNEAASWRPSDFPLGSPGVDESGAGGLQLPGDANQDGRADISDAVRLLQHLFLGSPSPMPCEGGAIGDPGNRALLDLNGDNGVNLSDGVYLLAYLFQGGPAPVLGAACVRIEGCPDVCGR